MTTHKLSISCFGYDKCKCLWLIGLVRNWNLTSNNIENNALKLWYILIVILTLWSNSVCIIDLESWINIDMVLIKDEKSSEHLFSNPCIRISTTCGPKSRIQHVTGVSTMKQNIVGHLSNRHGKQDSILIKRSPICTTTKGRLLDI